MNEEVIQFVGLNDLEDVDKELVKKLTEQYYPKIKRSLHNLTSLKVHVKIYAKEGARHKYSINVQAIAPTKNFQSDKASDWDLASSCHKAFKDLQVQIPHAFHDEVTRQNK